MNKNKEDAFADFINLILQSWTYSRLTDQEKRYFNDAFHHSSIKLSGSYNKRWEQLENMYTAFLFALGYNDDPINWRETKEELENYPKF